MVRARLPSIAKRLIQFECGADTTVQKRGRNAPASGIPLLLGEAIEKRQECLFAGELGCGLRFEVGAVELDPKLFWSPLDFPCPDEWTPRERVTTKY